MAKFIIENITAKQAEQLAHFYEHFGEQVADEWLREQGIRAPFTDVARKGGWMEIKDDGETVTLFCKSK